MDGWITIQEVDVHLVKESAFDLNRFTINTLFTFFKVTSLCNTLLISIWNLITALSVMNMKQVCRSIKHAVPGIALTIKRCGNCFFSFQSIVFVL